MADNRWGRSSSKDPDPAEPSGQASGSFSTESMDSTAQMPEPLRPSPGSAGPSALSATPPLPPANNALGSRPAPPASPSQSPSPSGQTGPLPGHSATAPTPAALPQTAITQPGPGFQPGGLSQVASTAPQQAPATAHSNPQPGSQSMERQGAPSIEQQGAQPSSPPSVGSNGWSPLGATPVGPPVRTATEPGAARYLPPVNPPQTVPTGPATSAPVSAEPEGRSRGRWGWRALVSFAAGGLIAAAGFGAAQLSPSGETEAGVETAVAESSQPTATTVPTTATTTRDSGTVPLVPLDVDEPASFVAQTLGPAVVQIDTDLGVGSGVIYGDGLILTNNHVLGEALTVQVQLADGRVLPGEVLGTDSKTDVGVVSVGPGLELPRAQLATGEKARVGQIAIAIGSPFDLQQSVTAGIVSAVDRPIPNTERGVVAMIQTDAPINPGNSGGALADRQGRVIGINTSIQTDGIGSTNVGVGFAIPIDTAIRIADLLVAGEPIQPGFLGVRGDEPPGGEAGVVLVDVTVGSAAEGAGLVVGDRVLSLNGAPVTGFAELAGLVVANQAGDTVVLEIVRENESLEIEVVLGVNDN